MHINEQKCQSGDTLLNDSYDFVSAADHAFVQQGVLVILMPTAKALPIKPAHRPM